MSKNNSNDLQELLLTALESATARILELEKALQFYATHEVQVWKKSGEYVHGAQGKACIDDGKIARDTIQFSQAAEMFKLALKK